MGWLKSIIWALCQCWVFDNAKVYGNAKVWGDAKVYGYAEVWGDAEVYDNAKVCGNAEATQMAKTFGNAFCYTITVTDKHIKIGCQQHLKSEWLNFQEGEIIEMDGSMMKYLDGLVQMEKKKQEN